MAYEWKLPGLYSVPAQEAGKELYRIREKRGRLDAHDVVDESRPEEAVLHPCFEWRDPVAAELWRDHQARNLISCIVVREEKPDSPPIEVRAFVHVCGTYQPTEVVINDEEKYIEHIRNIIRELKAFRKKHDTYADRPELRAIFNAIDAATA